MKREKLENVEKVAGGAGMKILRDDFGEGDSLRIEREERCRDDGGSKVFIERYHVIKRER